MFSVQSAYLKFHSTETAPSSRRRSFWCSGAALALLDLSAAFDTVDHQLLLLEILRHRFCVTDSSLAWFASYLSDRSQVFHINSTSSDVFYLDCGVPQGSVLGSKISITYTEDVDDVFDTHNIQHHGFADDKQIHVASTRSQVHTVTWRLSKCIADVTDWCDSRRLQLNSSTKTELMWFGTSSSLRGLSLFDKSLAVGDVNLQTVE